MGRSLVLAVAGLLPCVSLFGTLVDPVVVLPDNGGHVQHTGIAYLKGVVVEDFAQPSTLRKVLVDEGQELLPDVRLHIFAIGRVERDTVV